MGQQPRAGPVGTLPGVGIGIAPLDERRGKLVDKVGMAAAVAAPLREGEVLVIVGVVHAPGREPLDGYINMLCRFSNPGNWSNN